MDIFQQFSQEPADSIRKSSNQFKANVVPESSDQELMIKVCICSNERAFWAI